MTTPAPATTDWVPIWNLAGPASPPGTLQYLGSQLLAVAGQFDSNVILGGPIPSSFTHLKIIASLRAQAAAAAAGTDIRFNNDSAANYYWQVMDAIGTSTPASGTAATGTTGDTKAQLGACPGGSSSAGAFASQEITIPLYGSTVRTKSCHGQSYSGEQAGFTTNFGRARSAGGFWFNTAAINRIQLYVDNANPNFDVGSYCAIYGITDTVQTGRLISGLTIVTSLPGSPQDGTQVILTDNVTTPTYSWLLQWSALASKWIFIGGTPLKATDQANVNRSITVGGYATYPSAPSITLPRAGLYIVQCGAFLNISTASSTGSTAIAYTVGATVPQDYDAAIIYHTLSGGNDTNLIATCVSPASSKAIAAAGTILAMQGKCNGASGFATNTWIQATPIYVT